MTITDENKKRLLFLTGILVIVILGIHFSSHFENYFDIDLSDEMYYLISLYSTTRTSPRIESSF